MYVVHFGITVLKVISLSREILFDAKAPED